MIVPPVRFAKRWTSLRATVAGAPRSAAAVLRANGGFLSAVKLAVSRRGAMELCAEIPSFPNNEAWIARAREEMAAFAAGRPDPVPASIGRLEPDALDRLFALAEEAGFRPDIRAGGETCIPLGAGGREAWVRTIAGHCAVGVTALKTLPEDAACCEAVCAFALAATAEVRLVRASLIEDGRLVWEVPLADGLPSALIAHALHALATVARCAGREIEDLAAIPTLASEWMRYQQT